MPNETSPDTKYLVLHHPDKHKYWAIAVIGTRIRILFNSDGHAPKGSWLKYEGSSSEDAWREAKNRVAKKVNSDGYQLVDVMTESGIERSRGITRPAPELPPAMESVPVNGSEMASSPDVTKAASPEDGMFYEFRLPANNQEVAVFRDILDWVGEQLPVKVQALNAEDQPLPLIRRIGTWQLELEHRPLPEGVLEARAAGEVRPEHGVWPVILLMGVVHRLAEKSTFNGRLAWGKTLVVPGPRHHPEMIEAFGGTLAGIRGAAEAIGLMEPKLQGADLGDGPDFFL